MVLKFEQEYYAQAGLYKLLQSQQLISPIYLPRNLSYRRHTNNLSNPSSKIESIEISNFDNKLLFAIFQLSKTKSEFLYKLHGLYFTEESSMTISIQPVRNKCNEPDIVLFAFDITGNPNVPSTKNVVLSSKQLERVYQFLDLDDIELRGCGRLSWNANNLRSGTYSMKLVEQNGMSTTQTSFFIKWKQNFELKTKYLDVLNDRLSSKQKLKDATIVRNSACTTTQIIYFHYLYDDLLRRRTEKSTNIRCPWCNMFCSSAEGLICHLICSHDLFQYQIQIGAPNELHVNLIPTGKHGAQDTEVSRYLEPYVFIGTNGTKERNGADELRVTKLGNLSYKIEPQERKKSCFKTKQQSSFRQYFHSRTGAVILENELEYDSDDDLDNEWLLHESEKLMDEFEDVSLEEKEFMKMWNRSVHHFKIKADSNVPAACRAFAEQYGQRIVDSGLRYNFLLHLLNLWDFSLLNTDTITSCLQVVDNYQTLS